ncbi:O-antigen ligase family protein [Flavobacterium lindanitolerans]|uniref:O-antigen ligase family protein n=1 Tax=Flavobacterium lindanitolerans TaxID=428988 RepID=UPI0027BA13B4|nr:O-antigen ligase family protein [Flavobacterium lindanitolerans]
MASIYNSFKDVFQDLKKENSENKSFISVVVLLLSIPLGYAVNSIALGIFVGVSLITFQKENFKIKKNLVWPILLYLLMVLSLIWTLSVSRTLSSLSKELPLLLIPLCFFIIKIFTKDQLFKIFKYYSYGMLIYSVFYFIKATIRYLITKDISVFFYHELVTKDLNAIHVSIYMSLACFYFMSKKNKQLVDKMAIAVLTVTILFLSSKNVVIVFLALTVLYYFFHSEISKKAKYASGIGILLVLISLTFVKQVRDRFLVEVKTNVTENTLAEGDGMKNVYNVSIMQAWNNEKFQPNDYFPGTAFRVYQMRIFFEMMKEEPVFFTGYGLNASNIKVEEKAKEYNVHEGYAKYNFHNQYIQNFAELGFFGFAILLVMLFINVKNAINDKYFLHIVFAILMITLFLTESFLWRQRGIMYFTMMYCLFNSERLVMAQKK